MTSIGGIKARIAVIAVEAQQEVIESASERLDELDSRRNELSASIDGQEDQVEDLQKEMIGEKGDDLQELKEDAERVTAGVQRDSASLDVLEDKPKEEFDRVTEQMAHTNDALRSMIDVSAGMFEASMRGFA